MLRAAVTCAILAAAGPRRSRLLATLYRDERSSQLPHYNILSAMFFDRIIKPQDVAEFSGMLSEHQKAKLGPSSMVVVDDDEEPDDETAGAEEMEGVMGGVDSSVKRKKGPEDVLEKAIMEHNLLSASLVYSNITFSGLGRLLSLTKGSAEAMARTMIIQGRLRGASIDQVEGLITFERSDKDEKADAGSSNVAAAAAAAIAGEGGESEDVSPAVLAPETARWDLRIRRTAQLTEELAARCGMLMAAGA